MNIIAEQMLQTEGVISFRNEAGGTVAIFPVDNVIFVVDKEAQAPVPV